MKSALVKIVIIVFALFPVVTPAGELYFVQLTDTHLGVMDHEAVLEKMVEAVNSLPFPIAFVVHTGDLVMDNYDKPDVQESASRLLGKLKVPFHVVPGNHDLHVKTTKGVLDKWISSFGPLGSSVEYGGTKFLFVFTEGMHIKGPVGKFDPVQYLEKELKAAGKKPVILFQHSNWFEDFYDNKIHKGRNEDTRSRWTGLVCGGRVKAVITGHTHRDELHWEGDVPVYVGQAAARFWERQPSFRIYCWADGRLSYRTWYLSDVQRPARKR